MDSEDKMNQELTIGDMTQGRSNDEEWDHGGGVGGASGSKRRVNDDETLELVPPVGVGRRRSRSVQSNNERFNVQVQHNSIFTEGVGTSV